jgi:transketolase
MQIDQKTIQTIRTLAIDAVQKANSGHPGAPMGMAPVAYSLWKHLFRYSPEYPHWPNRDRFVLSAGHASALLYAMLHLTRVRNPMSQKNHKSEHAVSIDSLKTFRQLHSNCPGHPEFGDTVGVETTTGPLGQGLAASVGMAISERWLSARYNTSDYTIFDYNVYALCGDGCMMEGISHEAASLAGHLKLSNLVWIYDSNNITIEGSTDLSMSENIEQRFRSYNWDVFNVDDANDLKTLADVYSSVSEIYDKPVLIIVKSRIGYGSPNKEGSEAAHGAPLGSEEVRLTKKYYGWPEKNPFFTYSEVYEHLSDIFGRPGNAAALAWTEVLSEYAAEYPDKAQELNHIFNGTLPENWNRSLPDLSTLSDPIATRKASGKILNGLSAGIPWFMGGSADLGSSNNTLIIDESDFSSSNYSGRNFRFGVREFAMAAISNGMANAGILPYSATFLVFSDYMRPAIRLSALMNLKVLYVFTHDSISVGEDGPTHQPVEHLASLRAIPGLTVLRPSDAHEVKEAYRWYFEEADGPAAIVLSRQNLPIFNRTLFADASGLAKGGYILADNSGESLPDVILIATGSEVRLAVDAYCALAANNIKIRVVSMPSCEIFDRQTAAYRDKILPIDVKKRVIIEQGISFGWDRYVGKEGVKLTINRFGLSAPGNTLEEYFGFTAPNLIDIVRNMVE